MHASRICRRSFLKGAIAAPFVAGVGAPSGARAQDQSARIPDRLLFVVAALGGGSILDSFLPVASSEVSSFELAQTLAVQPDSLIEQPVGSNLRCVKNRSRNLFGLSPGQSISQSRFLARHAENTAVLAVEGSSVNHRVAQKRAVTGAGINRGRTLMESMALQYGETLLLPNCNMATDGYLSAGDDNSIPVRVRSEAIADARVFPLQTHGWRGIPGVSRRSLLEKARRIRDAVDEESPFSHTFENAPLRQHYLRQRALINSMEEMDLVTRLMMVSDDSLSFPLERYGLQSSPVAARVQEQFPKLLEDPFQAQAALAFLLARAGVSASLTLSPSFQPRLASAALTNTPLAFDFSHADHYATQNIMWSYVFNVVDGLIELLKSEPVDATDEAAGTLWDRSLIYIATDFGRDKTRPSGSNDWGSGHHLNNGVVVVSPLIHGNRVYGGVDPETCLTYGFDPVTGDARPDEKMREGEIYSAICHALGIDFPGRMDFPAFVRG